MSDPASKVYEIINPSDAYTISGDDFLSICLAVVYLGEGWYALQDEKGEMVMPICLGQMEWFEKQFGKPLDVLLKECDKSKLAAALDTVMIGDFSERRATELAIAGMSPEEARNHLAWHHEKLRSSMNDIGSYATKMAASWRRIAEREKAKGG